LGNCKRELNKSLAKAISWKFVKTSSKTFEATNPKKKYKSDLEVFIRESRLEDFFNDNGETIFVSTIHKAKGKSLIMFS
jgi:ATP-dependent DNA helicase RecQ